MSIYHPVTGLHYYNVIPSVWGAYTDVFNSYKEVSSRIPWVSVMEPNEFEFIRDQKDSRYMNEKSFFVMWDYALRAGPRAERKASVVPVYSEGLGSNMLDEHKAVFERFSAFASEFDGVLCNTAWSAEEIQKRTGLPGYVFLLGWNPNTTGLPQFNSFKEHDITFYGSIVGRREWIVPLLQEKFGHQLKMFNGIYGKNLIDLLNHSSMNIYISHSVGWLPTWRMWQFVSTSCCLISEPGNSWPLTNGDFLSIPTITKENIDEVIDKINEQFPMYDIYARNLHNSLKKYTVDFCIENQLIDISDQIVSSRMETV